MQQRCNVKCLENKSKKQALNLKHSAKYLKFKACQPLRSIYKPACTVPIYFWLPHTQTFPPAAVKQVTTLWMPSVA